MKTTFFLLFFVSFNFFGNAQTKDDWNNLTTGQWAFDVNPSLFILNHRLEYFLTKDDNKRISIPELLEKENVIVENNSYKEIKYGENQYLITRRKDKGNLRMFKVLKESENLYVLCSENRDICDCKANTFLYFKSESKLQRIEKAFSFSLKQNLLDRLTENKIIYKPNKEDLSFCEILKNL